MANRYQMWDKKSNVITPTGTIFTPEEWIDQWPYAGIDGIDVVIAGGTINGGFISEYSAFIRNFEDRGCNFDDCQSQEECLERAEEFEREEVELARLTPSAEERIAAALEAQVMLALDDERV